MSIAYTIDMGRETREAWELYVETALAQCRAERPTLADMRKTMPRRRFEDDNAYRRRVEEARDNAWGTRFDILRFRLNAPACVQAWRKGAHRPVIMLINAAPAAGEPAWEMRGADGSTVESPHPMPVDEIRILTGQKRH